MDFQHILDFKVRKKLILQDWRIKNLVDFYLTKWYNYAISYQGENPYVREKKSTRAVILLL